MIGTKITFCCNKLADSRTNEIVDTMANVSEKIGSNHYALRLLFLMVFQINVSKQLESTLYIYRCIFDSFYKITPVTIILLRSNSYQRPKLNIFKRFAVDEGR